MPDKRCHTSILIRSLRFADRNSRKSREKSDSAAAASNIYIFISNCQSIYSLGTQACANETLDPLRSMFISGIHAKKPEKYAIKLICFAEANNC
jgi:hypothetical protein